MKDHISIVRQSEMQSIRIKEPSNLRLLNLQWNKNVCNIILAVIALKERRNIKNIEPDKERESFFYFSG